MTFSMNNFTLTAEAIDLEAIEYVPLEGTIIPIKIDCIEGLKELIPDYGFGVIYGFNAKKRKIESAYIFINDETLKGSFCINYTADGIEDTECIHSPRFEFDRQEVACFVPELLTAWEQLVPYNIA